MEVPLQFRRHVHGRLVPLEQRKCHYEIEDSLQLVLLLLESPVELSQFLEVRLVLLDIPVYEIVLAKAARDQVQSSQGSVNRVAVDGSGASIEKTHPPVGQLLQKGQNIIVRGEDYWHVLGHILWVQILEVDLH